MDSLELDSDAFYICTEISPRNYVVQKAIQIDKSQIERMVGDLEKNAEANRGAGTSISQPPAPPLPYWFTRECKDKLMKVEAPAPGTLPSPSSNISLPQNAPSPIDVRQQVKNQLEYYFSRENLMTDRYLRCQMDSEQYVPITVIAGFRKITQLTNDYNLILEVLRESNLVEVDERGEKVRPITKRTTIILREIGQEYKEEVEKMLNGGPAYLDLKYGLNDSWYVTYDTEEHTQEAYVHLQNIEVMFNNRPICARIKAGGPPAHVDQQVQQPSMPEPSSDAFPQMMDLGQVLAAYGFVPVATYRPGSTVVHVEEDDASTPIVSRQQLRFSNGTRNGGSKKQNGHHKQQSQRYYDEGGSTSSASSGRYNNRDSISYNNHSNNSGANSWRKNDRTNDRTNYRRPNHHQQSETAHSPNNSTRYPPLGSSEPAPVISCDLPTPPVWPAPNHSKSANRKESITSEDQDRGTITPTPIETASSESGTTDSYQATRKQSIQSVASSSYSYEEQAFPCLPKPAKEPEKKVVKPTFSSVAAGKRNIKQIPESKKSYAEKLKERNLARSSS